MQTVRIKTGQLFQAGGGEAERSERFGEGR